MVTYSFEFLIAIGFFLFLVMFLLLFALYNSLKGLWGKKDEVCPSHVSFGGFEPFRTGGYKWRKIVGKYILYTEWGRYEGGDGFNDVRKVTYWLPSTNEEIDDYMEQNGRIG